MEPIYKRLGAEKAVKALRKNASGVEAWLECEEEHPEVWMRFAAAMAHKQGGRTSFIQQLSVSPFLFYRFSDGRRLWDVTRESFSAFAESATVEVWQEDSPYPKPGVVRKWVKSLL
jgi:hypothetical protein